jgi:hypothetical protein
MEKAAATSRWGGGEEWHGRLAREITRKMRGLPQTDRVLISAPSVGNKKNIRVIHLKLIAPVS